MMSLSQPDALATRIYLGNLPYTAKPYDIEEGLGINGLSHMEKIHVSFDLVSGRNPGYCFVDFPDRDADDLALGSLSATIGGRRIKVNWLVAASPRSSAIEARTKVSTPSSSDGAIGPPNPAMATRRPLNRLPTAP
ncbi:hypothetical protein J3459_018391 [Metarhizium acridum]|nr:hypothetical protein J3459_018391 [Metarhizium acridum]